eukprot:613119-Pelagomonas_calceolata.AAC.5
MQCRAVAGWALTTSLEERAQSLRGGEGLSEEAGFARCPGAQIQHENGRARQLNHHCMGRAAYLPGFARCPGAQIQHANKELPGRLVVIAWVMQPFYQSIHLFLRSTIWSVQ